jgi:hypothetical protein
MSNKPPNDSPGSLDHLTMRYLRRALDAPHPTDEPYVLNEVEAWVIRRVGLRTLALAAGLGLLGILLYYLPHYFWPVFFQDSTITIKSVSHAFPLISGLYGLLLLYVEVHALMYINLAAIRTVMAICQFPRAHDAQYEQHLRAIANAALNWQYSSFFALRADALFGLTGWGLSFFFWVNTAKALLSFGLLWWLAQSLTNQSVGLLAAGLISVVAFMFWNVFASFQILREAQVRVMAPLTIRSFVDELHEEWGKHEAFLILVPAVLACVGIQKRQYNYAHHLLAEAIEYQFGITVSYPTANALSEPPSLPTDVRKGLERLIIFAALVDGRLSSSEKKCLQHLRAKGWITYSLADIQQIGRQYYDGKGLWV